MITIQLFRRPLRTLLLAASLLAACSDSESRGNDEGSTEVTIIVEPSDKGSALLSAIGTAQRSVHMTMYILSSSPIRDALIERHKAGVEVQVVLNKDFPSNTSTDNQTVYNALKAAGVPVVWGPASFTFTHEKCIVIDGKAAWIMTMNASTSGLTSNREYLAIDTTPDDVAEAEAQFAADFAGTPYVPVGNLLMSPVSARPGILGLINRAKTTLDFEAEVMADQEVAAALCSAQARGVITRGVLSDSTPSTTQQNAVTKLKNCGVALFTLAKPYVHSKAIVVDGQSIYVGSVNFTMTSLDKNRELGLITSTEVAVEPVRKTVAADIAAGTAL